MPQSIGSQHIYIRDKVRNLNDLYPSRISFGLYLGTNVYNPSFRMKKPCKEPCLKINKPYGSVPINVGGLIKYRLDNYFQVSLEPGFFFGETYELIFEEPCDKRVRSTNNIIGLPVLIEFGLNRVNNMRPYLLTGISVNVNLTPKFEEVLTNERLNPVSEFQLRGLFVNYEVGMGIDFLLYKFRLTPSIRWSLSSDLLEKIQDPLPKYMSKVSSLKSIGFLINLAVSPN